MELLRRVIYNVIFLVTFFGSTWSFQVINRYGECRTYSGGLYRDVFSEGNDCAELGATPTTAVELQQAKGIEGYLMFFRGYCQRQSIVRECLSNATLHFKTCRNETYVQGFNVYRGFLETLLDMECTPGESTRLATFWHGLHHLVSNRTEVAKITPCFTRTLELTEDMADSNVDPPSLIFMFYKEMEWFKECIHQTDLVGEFKDIADVFLNEIVNRMECINPQDGNLDPCSTIDASLIRKTSTCSIKTRNDELTIYDALEDETGRCLDFLFEYGHPHFLDLSQRELVETVCSETKRIARCVSKLIPYSSKCMNETQRKEYEVLTDSVKTVFEVNCVDGGPTSIVEVLPVVFRLESNGHGNAVLDCINVAKSTRKSENTSSSMNMRFYHELETFKGCLVGKLDGDGTSVAAATSLIDEALRIVKCIHPENGTTVPCKSIERKVQVANEG